MTEIFLFVLMFNGGSLALVRSHSFPSVAECERALKSAKVVVPSHNNENENAAMMYCATEMQAQYQTYSGKQYWEKNERRW